MRKNPAPESGLFNPRILLAIALCSAGALLGVLSFAATPPSGTLSLATPTLMYNGSGPYVVPNATAQANGTPICAPDPGGQLCDDFTLTINVPAGTSATKQVKISVGWPVSAADFDVYVLARRDRRDGGDIVRFIVRSGSLYSAGGTGRFSNSDGAFRSGGTKLQRDGDVGRPAAATPPPPPPGTVAPRYQNYPPNPSNLPGPILPASLRLALIGIQTCRASNMTASIPGASRFSRRT